MRARSVAVAGSSGLIGTALCAHYAAQGARVVRLVRRPPSGPDEVRWDPAQRQLDPAALEGIDVVVNLAGAGVGDKRWTPQYKQLLVSSRVDTTRTLVEAMKRMSTPPAMFVNGSAQGFYGDRGEEELTETSSPGTGFLADLVQAWEAAAMPAQHDAGIPVALVRTGLVMSRTGGAFGKMLPLIKLGLGGPLGSGRQWWSWITLEDQVRGIAYLIEQTISGPVNFAAPDVARNIEVTRAVAKALGRPALMPAPAFALRGVLGEFSQDVLASTRMKPQVLVDNGFEFAHPDLASASAWVAGGA